MTFALFFPLALFAAVRWRTAACSQPSAALDRVAAVASPTRPRRRVLRPSRDRDPRLPVRNARSSSAFRSTWSSSPPSRPWTRSASARRSTCRMSGRSTPGYRRGRRPAPASVRRRQRRLHQLDVDPDPEPRSVDRLCDGHRLCGVALACEVGERFLVRALHLLLRAVPDHHVSADPSDGGARTSTARPLAWRSSMSFCRCRSSP